MRCYLFLYLSLSLLLCSAASDVTQQCDRGVDCSLFIDFIDQQTNKMNILMFCKLICVLFSRTFLGKFDLFGMTNACRQSQRQRQQKHWQKQIAWRTTGHKRERETKKTARKKNERVFCFLCFFVTHYSQFCCSNCLLGLSFIARMQRFRL